jgi:hypothetical protein
MQKSESQPQSSWKNFPTDTEGVVGFVYLIRNNHPDSKKKYYIGQKKLLKKVKKKPLKGKTRNRISYVDNDVEKYWGSSKELLADIEKYGIEHFSREVIEVCQSKFHMTYGELIWQIKCNALMDQKYYNGILNVRISKIPKGFIDVERNVDTLNL